MSEEIPKESQELPVSPPPRNKGGRPKGSRNRPKRGRPKGSGKPKRRGRPPKKRKPLTEAELAKQTYNLPSIKKIEEREKKEELTVLPNLEASVIEEKKASKKTEDQTIDRYLDDEKLLDAGYNTHTDKIINQEPIDPSFYYRGSKNVPVAGAQYEFTADMVEELRKCKEDIVYFAENFFYIVNLDRGKEKIKLYEAQKNMLMNMVTSRFSANLAARQSGKCLQAKSIIKIRNKNTGEIQDIAVKDLFDSILTD